MTVKQGEYAPVQKTETAAAAVPVVAAKADMPEGGRTKVEQFEVSHTQTWARGEVQEPGYKDVYFAVAFLVQLFVVMVVGLLFAFGAIETSDGDDGVSRKLDEYSNSNYDSGNNNDTDDGKLDFREDDTLFAVLIVSLLGSPIVAVMALGLMKEHAVFLIKFSLMFNVGLCVFIAVITLFSNPPAAVVYGFFAAILACYAKTVWHRIPYAAANLKSAITAIKMNLGIALLSFSALPIRFGWFVLWFYTLYQTFQTDFMKDQIEEEENPSQTDDLASGTTETISAIGYFIIILFMLSLYWTAEVIKNVIHTTVAGVIGTWWFLPEEASSFCSKGLTDSLARSTTYSFGSICLGSLIVAILEVIKNSLRNARNNRNAGVLRCVALCLLAWIERLAEYFNRWAFVYVGLYGYSYLDAGKNVISLFRARGWSTIISDNLVYRMLGMMSLAIGFLMALVSVIIVLIMGEFNWDMVFINSLIGFFVGILMSSIMMGAVGSSVDAIIVLFAEAPAEFEDNHPELSSEMQRTWSAAWAGVYTAHAEVVPEANVV